MKAETADYLAKARVTLADAQKIAAIPLPHIAAREACISVFHAAETYIFERTNKVAKTHRGVRSEFARLARNEPRIARDLVTFLGVAAASIFCPYEIPPSSNTSIVVSNSFLFRIDLASERMTSRRLTCFPSFLRM
jgi:hypothetical protein